MPFRKKQGNFGNFSDPNFSKNTRGTKKDHWYIFSNFVFMNNACYFPVNFLESDFISNTKDVKTSRIVREDISAINSPSSPILDSLEILASRFLYAPDSYVRILYSFLMIWCVNSPSITLTWCTRRYGSDHWIYREFILRLCGMCSGCKYLQWCFWKQAFKIWNNEKVYKIFQKGLEVSFCEVVWLYR